MEKLGKLHKKIALSLLLTTLILSSTILLALPVNADYLDFTGSVDGERQIISYGMLHDELFPEFNYTRWQRRSINVGFTAYGEMVTDRNPFDLTETAANVLDGSKYGVGLAYPTDSAWQVDMDTDDDGTDYGIYPSEHIATPAYSGGEWKYYPIEGWQLYWKFKSGTPSYSVDPYWHLSMAIYGNESAPHDPARLDVVPESDTVITDTSRLFIAKVVVRTYNATLATAFGFEPKLFEITALFVFFKNTKKVASYWTIEYLKSEYGPVDVVFRRMTDFDIDQKFQQGEDEAFAVLYANSKRDSWVPPTYPDELTSEAEDHMFWTGCEYWPQNYSLAVVWTNASIGHWVPPEGYSEAPQHHAAFVAYYPHCSNWDTDNWYHYVFNLHRPNAEPWNLVFGEGLGRRFGYQPDSVEGRVIDAAHYTGANLLLGQWNVTLSSATAYKKAKFLTVYGITNCSDTFGYVGDPSSYDWDSGTGYGGQITASEFKYLLSEYFNATYKLSTETPDDDGGTEYLDLSNWYPFSGVEWDGLAEYNGNSFIDREIGCGDDGGYDPRNTTFVIGDSAVHYDTVVAEGAATIDVVGAVMVGEAFGSFVDWTCLTCPVDPIWLAMYDIEAFSGLATAPYYTLEKDSLVYFDPVTVTLKLTGWTRRQNRACGQWYPLGETSPVDIDYFTTPTGCSWDVNHTINVGGPRVNLGTAYFNEHNWLVWVDPDATGSELDEAGVFSIPTGQFYPESEGGISVITITEDLNLTSWTAVHDAMGLWDRTTGCTTIRTNSSAPTGLDGPTLIDPYAGLSVWGISGVDTHAAAYWLAHYWCEFHELLINATTDHEKRGATALVLNTGKMADVCDETWMFAVQEIIGPPAGRWRFETGTTWGPWISYPCSIDWYE